MVSSIVSFALAIAVGSTGGVHAGHAPAPAGRILGPGPGAGWGFPNGNPDGYGWFDHGTALPLGANRTAEYYFPRYLAVPPDQLFLPTYYNPYVMRGQRYIPYAGCGGDHPMGGPPVGSASTPVYPYSVTVGSGPQVPLPTFSGRVEASPITSGGTGLTP
jgi:hypothetical protein